MVICAYWAMERRAGRPVESCMEFCEARPMERNVDRCME